MKVSVLVPTYRRAESLRRCMESLRSQIRLPDEVLIVTQVGDNESAQMLAEWSDWPNLRVITRPETGQVAQLNIGLEEVQGDVIAITDDDAVPRPDWLARIEQHFLTRPDVGGVGGRDYVQENGRPLVGHARMIGTVQWFGRVVGNHHVGGYFRDQVDLLKGANMSFRACAIEDQRFDPELRGKGAQTCNDWAFSMRLKSRGWRLIYDPAVAVDHFPATRHDSDQRSAPSRQAMSDSAFNFFLSIRRHMRSGVRKNMALLWAYLVGIENIPGVVRGGFSHLRGDADGKLKFRIARQAWHAAKASCSGSDTMGSAMAE